MYQQVYDPVSNSLGVSSIFAALPLITLFVLLGAVKMKAHWAGLISLAVARAVALAVYSMPAGQAFDSAAEGAAFGLFPIMWIVVNAVWIYTMTVKTGDFGVLRRTFGSISSDQRIQAVIVAFAFGALLEALAGFGTPVAITSVMLIALGFKPIKAASVALVANTAPVAFGAIAIPIVTLSQVTGLDKQDLGSMVGRQTPFVALIVPFILVFIVDGMRGLRQTWPVVFVGAVTFGVLQYVTSNFISVELTDIVASLGSALSMVVFLQVWQPSEPLEGEPMTGARPAVAGAESANPAVEREVGRPEGGGDSFGAIVRAYAPYLIIIAVFSIAQIGEVKDFLANRTHLFQWPGLHITNGKGKDLMSLTFKFDWAAAAGSLLLVSGIVTALALRVRPRVALEAYRDALDQLKWAILTVAAVLALAYVMNQSGQTTTIGVWAAGAGDAFAFLSPLIGWLGTAITGSDTSSNSLFGGLQVTPAKNPGLNPILPRAGNSSGGVLGKMISPQNLAIGAAAVGMAGGEGAPLRQGV